MSKNANISATQITDLVRVSSAAIFYEHENRFQVETWIFSSDPKQRSTDPVMKMMLKDCYIYRSMRQLFIEELC